MFFKLNLSHGSYPDGAADEAVSVVDFEHAFKQLVTGRLVCGHLTLQQVHGLRNTTREVHQCVSRVPPIQSLVAAVNPAGRGNYFIYSSYFFGTVAKQVTSDWLNVVTEIRP